MLIVVFEPVLVIVLVLVFETPGFNAEATFPWILMLPVDVTLPPTLTPAAVGPATLPLVMAPVMGSTVPLVLSNEIFLPLKAALTVTLPVLKVPPELASRFKLPPLTSMAELTLTE